MYANPFLCKLKVIFLLFILLVLLLILFSTSTTYLFKWRKKLFIFDDLMT